MNKHTAQKIIAAIAVSSVGFFSAAAMTAHAGDEHHNHHAMGEIKKSHAVNGEVVAVDKAASKVKLKHAPIPALKWPAMTMSFAVTDKSQLDGLKAGDKVNIEFVEVSGSIPLITQIKPVE